MGRRLTLLGRGLGLGGLLVLVVGTFLPWLRSGDVARNSYSALGVVQRLAGVPGLAGRLAPIWPFLGLICAAVVIVGAVGLSRTAALLGGLVALVAGAVSVFALQAHSGGDVSVAGAGPATTLVGSVLTVVAAILLTSGGVKGRRHEGGSRRE